MAAVNPENSSGNQFRPAPVVEEPAKKARPSESMKTARRFLRVLSSGGLLTKEQLTRAFPFLFFLTFIAMVYISNAYYAEKTIREIDKVTHELKDLRSEYIATKSDLMFVSKQSEVAKAVAATELREPLVPPGKIIVQENKVVVQPSGN